MPEFFFCREVRRGTEKNGEKWRKEEKNYREKNLSGISKFFCIE